MQRAYSTLFRLRYTNKTGDLTIRRLHNSPSKWQGGGVFDSSQRKTRTGGMHTRVVENFGIQKLVIRLHVTRNDLQYVITLSGHGETLHHFRQLLYMRLE